MNMKTYSFNDYKTTKQMYNEILSFLKENKLKYVIKINQTIFNISFSSEFAWEIFKNLCAKHSKRNNKTFIISKGNESVFLSKKEFKKLSNNKYDYDCDTKLRKISYNKCWYETYIKFFE